jgi:hypothetical protein
LKPTPKKADAVLAMFETGESAPSATAPGRKPSSADNDNQGYLTIGGEELMVQLRSKDDELRKVKEENDRMARRLSEIEDLVKSLQTRSPPPATAPPPASSFGSTRATVSASSSSFAVRHPINVSSSFL